MAREWYSKPINYYNNDQTKPYTVVVGVTTGNYNNGNPDTYVKTWMEYYKIPHTDADELANQSRVDVKLYSQVIDGGSDSGMSIWTGAENFGYAGWDNANRSSYSCTFDFNDKKLNKFFDGILTIPHLADGTKTITLQAGFSTNGRTSAITGGSTSDSVTLDAIEVYKATEIASATGFNYGFPTTLVLDRKASNLREEVWCSIGMHIQNIKGTANASTNLSFTIDREYTPNTAYPSTATGTITVHTYNGSTLIGTKTASYSWSIRSDDTANYIPTLANNPVGDIYNDIVPDLDTNPKTAVVYYSKIKVTASKSDITTQQNATIASRKVIFDTGQEVSDVDASTYTSNAINTAGEHKWVYEVTDSRGFKCKYNGSGITFINSNAPTLENVSIYRGDSSGNPSATGTYLYAQATVNYDSLGGHNTITLTGTVDNGTAQAMTSGVRKTLKSDASATTAYLITVTVSDLLRSQNVTQQIPFSDMPFNVRKEGNGVGIGQLAPTGSDHDNEANFGYKVIANKSISIKSGTQYNTDHIDYENFALKFYPNASMQTPSAKYGMDGVETDRSLMTGEYTEKHLVTTGNNSTSGLYGSLKRYNGNTILKQGEVALDTDGLRFSQNSNGNYYLPEYQARAIYAPTKSMIDGRYVLTCNLLDSSLIEQGYLTSSGGEGTDASIIQTYVKSDFFEVSSNTTYTFSSNLTEYGLHFFEYDSSKTFLRYTNVGQGLTAPVNFATGANTKYIRVQINKYHGVVQVTSPSDITWAQVEKGSNASSYVPCTRSGTEIVESLDDINTSMKWILRNGQTAKMKHQPLTYFGVKLFGYVGGYGGVDLWIRCTNGSLTVWDRDANSAWSRTDVLNIAYNSATGIFTFSCGQYGICLLLLGC